MIKVTLLETSYGKTTQEEYPAVPLKDSLVRVPDGWNERPYEGLRNVMRVWEILFDFNGEIIAYVIMP